MVMDNSRLGTFHYLVNTAGAGRPRNARFSEKANSGYVADVMENWRSNNSSYRVPPN
jgi:hypothetical protein